MTTRILFSALLLSAFVLTTGCRSTQRMIESGNYDETISFTVHKLKGRKKNDEHVRALETAFRKAQRRDLDLAERLATEGRAENWARIHGLHQGIRYRQDLVAPLLPLVSKDGYRAQFEMVDIAAMERDSREKAAEYLYNRATALLERAERGDKRAARDAYQVLCDLENRYYRNYKDKEDLQLKARDLGTSYVLFEVKNQSGQILPRNFADRLMAIGKNELNSEWKSFSFEAQPGVQYDYKAIFRVTRLDASPERMDERRYTDEKEIQDGWDYVLDKRGNVMKDTLGNDIKVPRMVRIRANVVEVHQIKAVRLSGYVEIRDGANDELLDTEDLATEVQFENYASTFFGDERALSQDSRCRIGNRPLPFPATEDMLVQAAERLKPNLRDELRRNRAIL